MLDVQQYLKLIRFQSRDVDKPTLHLLKQLVRAHLQTFCYQNADLLAQGLKPRAERVVCDFRLEKIFEQMVTYQRPGYCFQNAELFAWVLTTLGFKITKHLGKTIVQFSEQLKEGEVAKLPINHEVLIVDLSDEPEGVSQQWIVDVGFSSQSFREPLAIQLCEQEIASEIYRLHLYDNDRYLRLEVKINQRWFCLSEIDRMPKSDIEINEAHQQLFLMEKTPSILTFLKLGKVTEVKRKDIVYFPENPELRFFRSLSSFKKKYIVVPISPDLQMNRHTLAIEFTSEHTLNYVVLDPACSKTQKSTITGSITREDLYTFADKTQIDALWATLQNGTTNDLQSIIEPYLPHILAITAQREHTHRRIRQFTNISDVYTTAKDKFSVELDNTLPLSPS